MASKQARDRVSYGIAGVGPLLFFAVATVEGFLRADYDPIAQPISALALGSRGWIQGLNFLLLMVSLFSFAAVLREQLRNGGTAVAGLSVFVLMAIGIALAGAFRMDVPGAVPTITGQLHLLGGFLFFPWMPVGLLLVARRFRRDPRWRPYFAYTLVTGLFCLMTITFFLLFVGPPEIPRRYHAVAGLVQRLLILPFLVWMALVTHRAYRGPSPAFTRAQANDASRALPM
jgi:Protein of unknown function (DUF998)